MFLIKVDAICVQYTIYAQKANEKSNIKLAAGQRLVGGLLKNSYSASGGDACARNRFTGI